MLLLLQIVLMHSGLDRSTCISQPMIVMSAQALRSYEPAANVSSRVVYFQSDAVVCTCFVTSHFCPQAIDNYVKNPNYGYSVDWKVL